MKPESILIANILHDLGMISDNKYETFAAEGEGEPKSFWEILNQSATPSTIRDLMFKEINVFGKTGQRGGKSIRDALSVSFSNDEIRDLLVTFNPPVKKILQAVAEGTDLAESVDKIIDDLPNDDVKSYTQIVDRGYLQSRNINQVVSQLDESLRLRNRFGLVLPVLIEGGVLNEAEGKKLKNAIMSEGKTALPQIDDHVEGLLEDPPDLSVIDPSKISPTQDLMEAVKSELARRSLFIPIKKTKSTLEIASADAMPVALVDMLAFLTDREVMVHPIAERDLIHSINTVYNRKQQDEERKNLSAEEIRARQEPVAALTESEVENRSAVELVSSIIEGGIRYSATDVHLEPFGDGLRVRYRIDGRLRQVMSIPGSMVSSVNSRVKVLSGLNVTERRRPQDGHFSLNMATGGFDFRVSTLPTHIGEKTVIRILDESRVMHDLDSLGMLPEQSKKVTKWIQEPHGLILVTGPTGSGKSSTLYACLNMINGEDKNIITIEDPVEYRLEGVNQVQVDSAVNLSFASGLRSILRQDPDVIMVGEVRDPETARIAMRSSLTGHLVFSTLHTNTAAGVIATLGQMDIEAYRIVSAVTGIIAQRLIRIVCKECFKRFKPKPELMKTLGLDENLRKRLPRPVGCAACLQTGYQGRSGVYELMPISNTLAESVLAGKSEDELARISRSEGNPSMIDVATKKMLDSITTSEEILSVLGSEEG